VEFSAADPQRLRDSQLFASHPDPTWGVDCLGEYARQQDQAIVNGEQALTAYYWRLGLALELARKQFSHSQWGRYLSSLGIDKTRASRARAIQRTFEAEEQVAELSVKEAYSRRKRQPRKSPILRSASRAPVAERHEEVDLVNFLVGVCHQVESCLSQAESASAEQANCYLSVLEEALRELNGLRQRLLQRVTAK